MRHEIGALLSANSYPGRGIIIGATPDGESSVLAYFIMGRSVNSRNRIFELTDDGIRTCAYDERKMTDPSLIIYHPVREVGDMLVVSNGDQTDTIKEFLERGQSFEEALRTRRFEPDGPNWTPRISGIIMPDGSYTLSILKSADMTGTMCLRQTFEYPPAAGTGHFLHTYRCDGNPIPPFSGEPEEIETVNDIDEFSSILWSNLNPNNKVSLYVRYTDINIGTYEEKIYNYNEE